MGPKYAVRHKRLTNGNSGNLPVELDCQKLNRSTLHDWCEG